MHENSAGNLRCLHNVSLTLTDPSDDDLSGIEERKETTNVSFRRARQFLRSGRSIHADELESREALERESDENLRHRNSD